MDFCPMKKNNKTDLERLRERAHSQETGAQYELARRYEKGHGASRNPRWALFWYKKAAEGGHVEAQRILGDFYAEGRATTGDFKAAVYWYRRAAGQNDTIAMIRLG
jgi:hypothetical protein